jgi:hypothetical protein
MSTTQTLQVVSKFLELAQDTTTQSYLVQDSTILSSLVNFLTSTDKQVVEMASAILKLLAREEKNRQTLYNQPQLVSTLTELTGSLNSRVKNNAISAMTRLNKFGLQEDTENMPSTNTTTTTSNIPLTKHTMSKDKKRKKNRKTRTYVFFIAGGMEDDELVQNMEVQIVKVQGIQSLTMDQCKGHVLVTSKEKKKEITRTIIPAVLRAVRKTGASATLLGELGKKKTHQMIAQAQEEEQENTMNDDDGAGYLDDSEYFGGDRQGVLSRFASTSLQAKLADQRRKELEMANQTSAVNSVAAAAGSAVLGVASWFGY